MTERHGWADAACALGVAALTLTLLLGLVQLQAALRALAAARSAPPVVQLAAGPSTGDVRATLTPRPTRTRVPTATPTQAPAGGRELLRDGGFEVGDAWEIIPTVRTADYVHQPAAYVSNPVRSGQRALRLGIAGGADAYSYSAAEQWATIPADAGAVRLSLWVYLDTQDRGDDTTYVLIVREQGGYDILLQALPAAEGWQRLELSLDGYRGQRIAVHLELKNDGDGSPTALYVDDVSLTVEA